MKRLYSLNDVARLTKEEWKAQQPFYKYLAEQGYFTDSLPMTDFYTAFYAAIDHPLPKGKDPHLHLKSYLLHKKDIAIGLFLLPTTYRLTLLMIQVDWTGLWAVYWRIIIRLCQKYGIREIDLMDRAVFGDPWTHYGFSGHLHDQHRYLRL